MSTLQTCTSGSRPSHGAGVIAYETDTTRTIISDGSNWHLYMPDLFTRATCAFSLRQIVPDYTGHCVKVRRSSDNGEVDIGFTDTGVIDQAALLTHTGTTGSDTGQVVTWYDQGPDSMNATNTTAAQQPTIVSAGAVVVSNSKPSLAFDAAGAGSADMLLCPDYVARRKETMMWQMANPTPNAGLAVCELTDVTDTSDKVLFGTTYTSLFDTLGDSLGASDNSGMKFKRVSAPNSPAGVQLWDTAALVNTTQAIAWFNFNGTTTGISTNGGSEQTTTDTPNPYSLVMQTVGSGQYASQGWEGKISELVLYTLDRSAQKAAILANVNGFYGTY